MERTRRVSFADVTNFRDLGGYATAVGGTTRWDQVFRSDSLHNFTPDDLAMFDRLGLQMIYDLRRDEECEREPGPRPCVRLTVPSATAEVTDPRTLHSRVDGEAWLFEDYRNMLASGGVVFGELLSCLAHDDIPAVFHCAGGKDRTGMVAALFLSWLGVDRKTVLDDYELTERYRGVDHVPDVVDHFVARGIVRPVAEGMLSAPRWAMADALRVLDRDYDGVESYLRESCGLTDRSLDSLRTRFVA